MIIGLTGGIASGKTTVSNFFKEKGFLVFDADKIAKDISEQKEVVEEIILHFGKEILDENLKIDRKKLKNIIFKDKKKLETLNKIIHPKVYSFYKDIKKNKKLKKVVFDVPLLFESGIDKLCDRVLLVVANREIKIDRIMKRDNISQELAEKIIDSQMSDEEKIKKADIVIENNEDIEKLLRKIERFCEFLWK